MLFIGRKDDRTNAWAFRLNDSVTWADISPETKGRLRSLAAEAQAAYARKFPHRRSEMWGVRTAKYRPPGSNRLFQVPLLDMVTSLVGIWVENEGGGSAAGGPHCRAKP